MPNSKTTNTEYIDLIIIMVANALDSDLDKDEIRSVILSRGWSEDEAYLFMKAGEQLSNYRKIK